MSKPFSNREIAILLLAAGSSSRLGRSKQLVSIKGQPLLLKSMNAAIESGIENIIVVLGANEQEHYQVIKDAGVQVVVNTAWKKGMGNSLKVGLFYLLQQTPKAEAVITMVCDQPLITSDQLKKLIAEYESSRSAIVASFYQGVAGVPVLFDRTLFSELLSMSDEAGAKKILQEHPHLVKTVPFPGGEIDIDTEDDLRKFLMH
ncbi:MAG: nucleotidyltransferase family protein [Cytophagales bacterium]|nr:nucleotidyltransferase family protein [Cytophagales bacterium]MCA6387120.1 nucleotidyltransferase family protein [Cytophagales bacterium]MCA6390365.1 nucleotidyltransferase family protein [Cytophagales bacterium]MCA6396219.1 nucleotidyltransferase family protein [Cytophagales bacterium]MCA6399727.1 nucleotidyltransferase family protein [Cytophagales bacterium]